MVSPSRLCVCADNLMQRASNTKSARRKQGRRQSVHWFDSSLVHTRLCGVGWTRELAMHTDASVRAKLARATIKRMPPIPIWRLKRRFYCFLPVDTCTAPPKVGLDLFTSLFILLDWLFFRQSRSIAPANDGGRLHYDSSYMSRLVGFFTLVFETF